MSGDFEEWSSAQLVRRVRQGDADAFTALSARYLWLVRAKAHRFAGTQAPEVEDLTQEGLLGLYTAAVSFDEKAGASFPLMRGCAFITAWQVLCGAMAAAATGL